MSLLAMRGVEPPGQTLLRLILAGTATASVVIYLWWRLEQAWFPFHATPAVSGFYTLRGFLLAWLVVSLTWWVVKRYRTTAAEVDHVFRFFADSTADALIGAERSGRINYANPAALRMFGRDKLVGESLTVLMPDDYRTSHRAGLVRFLHTGESKVAGRELLVAAEHADGHTFPVALTVTILKRKPVQFFGVIRMLEPELGAIREAMESVVDAREG